MLNRIDKLYPELVMTQARSKACAMTNLRRCC
jgi:hypothetical protein